MYKGVKQAICIEREFLDGNLNRMMVADSERELRDMFAFAVERLITLRNLNFQRLVEEKEFKESGN